jgi:Protein of unknown function (DUF2752)
MSLNSRRWLANLVAFAAGAVAFVIRRFPPANSRFYPRCPVLLWLHVYCPGCGGTRAVAALLHFRLEEAMHWNAMVVIFFPFAAVFLALTYGRAMKEKQFIWPMIPDSLLKLSLVLIAIFTVVRNLSAQ